MTRERPAFLIVDHPQFRSYDLAPHIWDWTGDRRESVPGYPEEYIEEFDYEPPESPGECGTAATP